MDQRTCPSCGDPVTGHPNKVFCSACRPKVAKRRLDLPARPCERCGTEYVPYVRRQRWCSDRCRHEPARSDPRPCAYCGTPHARLYKAKYCSDACSWKAKQAKGRGIRTCERCGDEYLAGGLYQRYCSTACVHPVTSVTTVTHLPWATCLQCRRWWLVRGGRAFCPYPSCLRAKWRTYYKVRPLHRCTCEQCGKGFESRWPKRHCSETCYRKTDTYRSGRRRNAKMREARKRGATEYESFDPVEVFERDRYRCGICGKRTLKTKRAPHPRSPSLDHVVPLAEGGAHTRANTQCACFLCNAVKGERTVPQGEQLRLVG